MNLYLYLRKSCLYCSALLFFVLSWSTASHAGDGDTTNVFVHDLVDMTWNGNYDRWGVFPDDSKTYRKITMFYTLGCSSAQCSDWDYTTQIFLAADTADFSKKLELGRVITPYGGYMANGTNGFGPNWNHTYAFDLTDFASVLQGNQMIRAFYDGWSDGFSVSLRFEFIEGTPPREAKNIENLYHGRGGYSSWVNFDLNHMLGKTINVPADVVGMRSRVSITGHGFDNNTNCAEFCNRSYTFEVDDAPIATVAMWRGDCGLNPIYPQGGTWLYNRADWCPGDKNTLHIHELTPYITSGADNELNMDLQNYAWSGTQEPYYIYDVQLVSYGAPNFSRDVELIDIISPSNQDPYSRMNPICGKPKIKIRNSGSSAVSSITFRYGATGGAFCDYTWSGSLDFLEEATVELPTPSWAGLDEDDPRFEVRILNVNGSADEYASNDRMESAFSLPAKYNDAVVMWLGTNSVGSETGYSVMDSEGNVLVDVPAGSLPSNALSKDTFDFGPGCYTFRLVDTGGDGLSWWVNGDGDGSLVFRSLGGLLLKNFQADFGSEVYLQFTYGELSDVNSGGGCTLVANEDVKDLEPSKLNILPNPNNGQFTLRIDGIRATDAHLSVIDLLGRTIQEETLEQLEEGYLKNISLESLAKGIYMVRLRVGELEYTEKVIVQ